MVKQIPMKHTVYLSLLSSSMAYVTERPSIVYIFTDQHTTNAMSCAGNSDIHTPSLDRLAVASTMFQSVYRMVPLNGFSRGAIFTGHYPGSVGLSTNGASLPEAFQIQTPGTLVEDAGYECTYGGKQHVSELDTPDEMCRFDQIRRYSDDGLTKACAQFLSRKYDKPPLLAASHDSPYNICEYACGQNLPYGNMEIPEIRDCPGPPSNSTRDPYDVDVIEEERDSSFNIYPTAAFASGDRRMYRYTYYRLVEEVGREIGKIIGAIDKSNLWKSTAAIFSSDYGDGIGAHHQNQESTLYEEMVSTPPIVALPGKRYTGERLPQLISSGVDFFATTCDWTETEKLESTTGKLLRKITEEDNPQAPHQDYIVIETHLDSSKIRGWMVRTERCRYVLYDRGRRREQLFDMQSGRGEIRNLMMENVCEKVAQ